MKTLQHLSILLPSLFSITVAFAGLNQGLPSLGSSFDRFSVTCPADRDCIRLFSPSLVANTSSDNEEETWVAVYRSNNNLPSVVREDFFNAMEIATTSTLSSDGENQIETGKGILQNAPVAVARLRRSSTSNSDGLNNSWLLDSMRCTLKKESQDDKCDGGSEHVEALSVCIDELILHHLKRDDITFEKAIRCKATLVSGKILENRGFEEVQELGQDMATHVSSLDGSIEKYALRISDVNGVVASSPKTMDRTLQILSLLGRLDQQEDKQKAEDSAGNTGGEDEGYDPWASVKKFI
eukprot:CAMPEP_0195522560 /NCGR_PEP_ID=MMETSP0794_2-20130614/20836_1 /TAXON_ID=515487 /ORGANISM="Stephanopyxis turris, Strain CCMP 815" /LENGTH=295 /DNA_ID=CAMNT_0040652343 /DNA_START=27 /DNA_END=914 /DNA_ORIENTATION=+